MKYQKIKEYPIDVLKSYYKSISGGIDGYYEKTIINADVYIVKDVKIMAYFSVHSERGLTSLIVIHEFQHKYDEIFEFVMKSNLFNNILFTGKDKMFFESVKKHKLKYKVQAYNFESSMNMNTSFKMKKVNNENINLVIDQFSEFIQYNQMDINEIESFLFEDNGNIICFGALEPMVINENRYAISMIVNEQFRGQGYGTKVVQFLVQYVQQKGKEINARCYVLNEVSKKTLLRSGLTISNMLFKVEGI